MNRSQIAGDGECPKMPSTMWKFMRFHIELIRAPSLTCELQNKWAMLDGESKPLILEALVKKNYYSRCASTACL